jgi:hypothetical protein
MALVRNISTGPRGAYLDGVLHWAEVGQSIEADDFALEWFEEVGGDAPELADMTVVQLRAFAKAKGITLGDVTTKADIISTIELALEAK